MGKCESLDWLHIKTSFLPLAYPSDSFLFFRRMVSGGADGSIRIWDLESCPDPHQPCLYRPLSAIGRQRPALFMEGHISGVTHVDFHPFKKDHFLTGSFDKSLKLWSCATSTVTAHYDIKSKVFAHAASPISSSPVIACATQDSNVRLVDLRTNSSARSLLASGGAVFSVAWSPRHERVLASGHADGKARVWDVRRALSPLGMLDMEDSLGILHRYNHAIASGLGWSYMPKVREAATAHADAVNGLAWTDDGNYIVTAGLDRRIRVWNATTGANTLAGFGSTVRNSTIGPLHMVIPPSNLTGGCRELLFWPNEQEILVFDLHEGYVVSRMRVPGPSSTGFDYSSKNRITCMAWRGAGGARRLLGPDMGGATAAGGIYTSHADGHIRAWLPRITDKDEIKDDTGAGSDEEDTRKRKRQVLDDAYRSLMGKQVTFT